MSQSNAQREKQQEIAMTEDDAWQLFTRSGHKRKQMNPSSSHLTNKRTRRNVSSYKSVPLPRFTCAQMHAVCNSNEWPGHSKLRKQELMIFVAANLRKSGKTLFDHRRCLVYRARFLINHTDPITMDDISQRPNAFLFVLPVDKEEALLYEPQRMYIFCPLSLVKNIMITGKIENVFTRQKLSHEDLQRLEVQYASCLRINPDTPADPTNIFAMRPDLNPVEISQVIPTRENLNLSADDPLPCPFNGFAPWLVCISLLEASEVVRKNADVQRADEELLGMLLDDLVTFFDTMLTLGPQGIDGTHENRYCSFWSLGVRVCIPTCIRMCVRIAALSFSNFLSTFSLCIENMLQKTHDPGKDIRYGNFWKWFSARLVDACVHEMEQVLNTREDAEVPHDLHQLEAFHEIHGSSKWTMQAIAINVATLEASGLVV
jgi:hypothetical protein